MVQLDDLDRVEEARRLLREVHRQHCADREVGGDEDGHIGFGGEPASDLSDSFVVETGCADNRMNAVLDEEL
jgi:hypothetical protein